MDEIKFKESLREYNEDIELRKYTTIFLGGRAKFLVVADDLQKLTSAISSARDFGVNYRVIGYGSNLLISDKGFDGLVIVNRANEINIDKSKSQVIAQSGAALAKLILEASSAGLSGLEPLYGIPGTVGGAVCVNAGAHKTAISNCIKSATIMFSSDKIVTVQKDWFEFGYRSSRLKYKKDEFPPVILSITFQFQQKRPKDILEEIAKYKAWREEHQPLGEKTCGSVFRNPSGQDKNDGVRDMTAGYLLEEAGAKKFKEGFIKVSKRHANWIINDGRGSALQARKLIERMRSAVDEKFSVSLEEEIEYLGDWS